MSRKGRGAIKLIEKEPANSSLRQRVWQKRKQKGADS